MEFWDTIRNRHSVRSYAPGTVTREEIERVLEAATLAPSGGNMQPWHFYVVTDEDRRAAVTAATYSSRDLSAGPQSWMMEAPVFKVVCRHLRRAADKYDRMGRDFIALQDCAAAVENMLLAATALGLGSCWVGGFRLTEVADALDLPAEHDPVAIVVLGRTTARPRRRPRLSLDEVTTWL